GDARALASGVRQDTIDKLKARGLNKGEQLAYNYMRQVLDHLLTPIQDVMHHLWNIQVFPERNYFPWMTQYELYHSPAQIVNPQTGKTVAEEDLNAFFRIVGNFFGRNSSQVPHGFTLERLEGAERPIRFDAFGVFEYHVRNANRLVEMQPTLKMAGEMIRSDQFAQKFGRQWQYMLNDWRTQVATDGAGPGTHRMSLVDMARRGASRSLVFFRLTSNIKHLSAVPHAVMNAGGFNYFYEGLYHQFSAEGQAFLDKIPQVMSRQAGDISLQELQDRMAKFGPIRWADRWGFVIGKEVDAINSRAVLIARYLQNLRDKGLTPSLTAPVNMQALANALVFMRRSVSSTLAKDIQPVLCRGLGFGGNVTL